MKFLAAVKVSWVGDGGSVFSPPEKTKIPIFDIIVKIASSPMAIGTDVLSEYNDLLCPYCST